MRYSALFLQWILMMVLFISTSSFGKSRAQCFEPNSNLPQLKEIQSTLKKIEIPLSSPEGSEGSILLIYKNQNEKTLFIQKLSFLSNGRWEVLIDLRNKQSSQAGISFLFFGKDDGTIDFNQTNPPKATVKFLKCGDNNWIKVNQNIPKTKTGWEVGLGISNKLNDIKFWVNEIEKTLRSKKGELIK